jgi:nitroreductase
MDVFDAVRTVLAVRQYQDKPVSPDVIRQIVEAGRLTASASNKQPWHFIVVEDRNLLNQLASLATTGGYINQAPLVVVVAIEDTKWSVSDASRAVQSMILTAWANGIGSNWVGFIGALEQVKQPLGIPNNLNVLAIVPLGYPAQPTGGGKKNRRPLEEVASLNRYGQPYKP